MERTWHLSMNELVNKPILIALVGKSSAGKDTCLREFLEYYPPSAYPKWNKVILTTTRPPRQGEQDGVNYYFITPDVMGEKIFNGEMITVKKYRDWYYGVSYDSFKADCSNIGVFSPEELQDIIDTEDFNILIIYINAEDSIRLFRSIQRTPNNCIEICRRFLADNEDFAKIHFTPDLTLNSDTMTPAQMATKIRWAIQQKFNI